MQLLADLQLLGGEPDEVCRNAMVTSCERHQWQLAVALVADAGDPWRRAKLSQLVDRRVELERPESWILPDLEDLSFSKLVVLTWAAASLSAHLSGKLGQEVMRRLSRGDAALLSMENIAKLAWAISMLPATSTTPLALHHLQLELTQRANKMHVIDEDIEGFVASFLEDAFTVLWSSSFAGFLFEAAAHAAWRLLRLLRFPVQIHPLESLNEGVCNTAEPHVVQLLPDQLVIFKPPGWEVDYATGSAGVARSLLSSFLSAWLTPRRLCCKQKLRQTQEQN